ncbi:hypothetical protein [Nocardioides caricicola]|uniref:Uncharacterized protein n=1 Tax=Nocardioides caricicola TaxID=634770 RepID=A0ABW0MXY7_9ACTN
MHEPGARLRGGVRYEEPILTLDSVTGPGGRPVESLRLTRIREDGVPVSPIGVEDFGLEPGPGRSVTCRVPCGFGNMPAVVSFVDSVTGQEHRFEVSYEGSRPGCGGALYGGTHVDLDLGE